MIPSSLCCSCWRSDPQHYVCVLAEAYPALLQALAMEPPAETKPVSRMGVELGMGLNLGYMPVKSRSHDMTPVSICH